MEAAAIAMGQVGNMRRVHNHLGDEAEAYDSWNEARRAASGQDDPIVRDDDWVQAQAQVLADRMRKAFGSKLPNNIELAAAALEIHFGRKLDDLVAELRGGVSEDDEEDEMPDF